MAGATLFFVQRAIDASFLSIDPRTCPVPETKKGSFCEKLRDPMPAALRGM